MGAKGWIKPNSKLRQAAAEREIPGATRHRDGIESKLAECPHALPVGI
jgi:hypothetical protein